jgi:hypothetical protein
MSKLYEEESEAIRDEEIGKFIPPKELLAWWKQQQKKYPKIFTAEEACPTQHALDTKLMSYQDDDPSRPVRVIVKGSRWRKDKFMGKQAMYILEDSVTRELTLTEVTSAHEEEIGWLVGWNAPPPRDDE